MTKKAWIVVPVIIYLGIAGPAGYILYLAFSESELIENKQLVELKISVRDEYGAIPLPTFIHVLQLADNGLKFLASGTVNERGGLKLVITIPRILKLDERRARRLGVADRDIYAAVNVWIIASNPSLSKIGTLTLAIDPTYMKHPLDTVNLRVKLRTVPARNAQAGSERPVATEGCDSAYRPSGEAWKYTRVLEFSTWDNVTASYDYVDGSKIRVESKERYYDYYTCQFTSYWYTSGSTIVTLDGGIRSRKPLGGRKVWYLDFELKYILTWYYPPGTQYPVIVKVYAADTSTDPRAYRRYSSAWRGELPGWSYFYSTLQEDCRSIPVTGSYTGYSFSVSVGFSTPYFPISVSLGVGKQPSPKSYLHICTGSWYSNYVAKTESPDSSFLKTRTNWVKD